jgi:hypothetical protein
MKYVPSLLALTLLAVPAQAKDTLNLFCQDPFGEGAASIYITVATNIQDPHPEVTDFQVVQWLHGKSYNRMEQFNRVEDQPDSGYLDFRWAGPLRTSNDMTMFGRLWWNSPSLPNGYDGWPASGKSGWQYQEFVNFPGSQAAPRSIAAPLPCKKMG